MLDKYTIPVENNIYEISKAFAVRIVNLYSHLTENKKEFVMSKQLLRSGTSIGANVFEGKQAQSRADFSSKMNIALKEASESGYWIELLYDTHFLSDSEYESLFSDCKRIIAVLTKIVKSTKVQ
jgi:four helix bundle protein